MKTRTLLAALLAVLALLAASCGDDDDTTSASGDTDGASEVADGPPIRIGAQQFGESVLLAEVYGQVLEANGYDVEQVEVGGFRDVLLSAFDSGEVGLSLEYAASMLEYLNENAGEATSDTDETVEALQAQLAEIELTAAAPADAQNTNAFVVTRTLAEDRGFEALSDLPADGGGLKLGAPQDCETNPNCLPGLERVYGVDLSDGFTPLDTNLVTDALLADEVQIGVLFSTSIYNEELVVLEDDQGMLAADNIVPVVSDELVDAYGQELIDLLDEISAALDTETLSSLNQRVDVDKEDPEDVAAAFIEEAGLGAEG